MNFLDLLEDIGRLSMAPAELVLRGTLMYWFLFLIFRFILRRDIGSMGVSDFLFVVLLGDAAQNSMIGTATSVTEGAILIGTLVFWNFALDFVSYKFPGLERLLQAKKLCLVRDGKMNKRNMRREYISPDELMAKIREAGVEDMAGVKGAYLESDGEISVIKR